LGLPQLRWWNNHAWTEQTSAARQPMVVQDTKFAWADDELPSRRDERLRERGQDRLPNNNVAPTAEALRELEPPRAFAQFGQTQAPQTQAPQTQAAQTQAAPTQAAQSTPVAPTMPVPPTVPVAASTPVETPAAAATQQKPIFEPASATETPRVDSLYTPDPIVDSPFAESLFTEAPFARPAEAPTSPSLDTIFDAKPMTTPAAALDAIFGENEARRSGTRVKTPIVTVEQVATTTGSAQQSSTGAAYLMAIIPIVQLVVSLLLLTSLGMNGSQFIYLAILIVPYFLAVVLAYIDHTGLKRAGHTGLPHWAWAFLTVPAYLILRARVLMRETGHGISPVLVWFGNLILQAASVIAVPGVLIALMPSVFITQLEQSVAHDAMLFAGANMSISCPVSMPPVLPGEQVTCVSTNSSGAKQDIIVTLQRANGWISWQVIDWGSYHKS